MDGCTDVDATFRSLTVADWCIVSKSANISCTSVSTGAGVSASDAGRNIKSGDTSTIKSIEITNWHGRVVNFATGLLPARPPPQLLELAIATREIANDCVLC